MEQIPTLDSSELASSMNLSANAYLEKILEVAKLIIGDYTKDCRPIPEPVLNIACEELARELYNRKDAPNGVKTFGGIDGAVIRIARDAFVAARPLLSRYRKMPFA